MEQWFSVYYSALLNMSVCVCQVWASRAYGAQDCGGESVVPYQLAGERRARTPPVTLSTLFH